MQMPKSVGSGKQRWALTMNLGYHYQVHSLRAGRHQQYKIAEDLHKQATMLIHLFADAIVQTPSQKAAKRDVPSSSLSRQRR